MNITITAHGGQKSEYFFEKKSVIVGRGQNSDIVISDDHISRKHLEIKLVEEQIYIKDLTLSNWVSYNEEKLEKNMDIQYYDFAPLALPGNYIVEISDTVVVESSIKVNLQKTDLNIKKNKTSSINRVNSATKTNIQEYELESSKKKKIKQKEKKKKIKKEKGSNELLKMVSIVLIVISFIVYQFFFTTKDLKKTSSATSPSLPIKKEVNQNLSTFTEQSKRKKEKEKIDKIQNIIDMQEKCQTSETKDICKLFFPAITLKEGYYREGLTMYVVKNLRVRAAYLLGSSSKVFETKISPQKLSLIHI